MSIQRQARRIRARKLGILLKDARQAAQKSLEECAQAVGANVDRYQGYESGAHVLSLPELELLAYYFNLPLEHFWQSSVLSAQLTPNDPLDATRLLPLRQKMIGAQMRQARDRQNKSLLEISQVTEISEEQITSYEMGEIPIPLTDLESLAAALGINIQDLFDVHGPVGMWRNKQDAMALFLSLPPELREFVSKPVNRPYLEVAMRLSQLSTEKLRSVAEGLLEITY